MCTTAGPLLPALHYREAKVKPHNRADFDELLDAASAVSYMEFTESGHDASMAAGEELLERSDRVFAVWDGGPSGGKGGTADVVHAATALGLPIEVFWPPGASRMWNSQAALHDGDHRCLQLIVRRGPIVHVSVSHRSR